MRFSSIFQLPLPKAATVPPEPVRVQDVVVPIAVAADPPDSALGALASLPEALDERVRLVGEWQLGES